VAADPARQLDDAEIVHAELRLDALGAAEVASAVADFHARAAAIALGVARRPAGNDRRTVMIVTAVSPALVRGDR